MIVVLRIFVVLGIPLCVFPNGIYQELSDCFIWGKKFSPSPESFVQDIQPIVYTKVQKPLTLIFECYHDYTCLFVTCDNVVKDNVTCEVWPGLTGYTKDYISDETRALVVRSSSWTYNTTCQYWSYRDTLQHCLEYFIPPDEISNATTAVTVETLPKCYDACRADWECFGFTYYWESDQCWLHNRVFGTVQSYEDTDVILYSLVSGRMKCLFKSDLEEPCFKREISFHGNELPHLERYSHLTQEEVDFKYSYRSPSICKKRCEEYKGECYFFTLDVITLKCTLHGPNVTTADNIFSYTGNHACFSGLQCVDLIAAILHESLDVKCLLTRTNANKVTWSVGGVPIGAEDPRYSIEKKQPSDGELGYVLLRVHNVTEYQMSINVTAKLKGLPYYVSQAITVTSILFDKPLDLGPFDTTNSGKNLKMSPAEVVRSPGGYVTHSKDLSQDGNVYTCSWTRTDEKNKMRFLKLTFPESHFVDEVVVHTMFYMTSKLREKWYQGKNDDKCQRSEDDYWSCKDNEGPFKVAMRNCTNNKCSKYSEYLCGVVSPSHGLSQGEQIYKVTCRSVGDQVVIYRDTPGDIRVCEFQTNNYPQECPEDHYLSYPGHVCLPCPDRYNSNPYTCEDEIWGCDPDTNMATAIYMCSSENAVWELPPAARIEINSGISLKRNEQPSSSSSSSSSFEPSRLFDRVLNTCVTSLSNGKDTPVWFKLSLGELYKVNSVTIYTIFNDDWFFYPPKRSECHSNLAEYKACKNAEGSTTVKLLKGETEAKLCGVLEISSRLTSQIDQIYLVTCDDTGDSILLESGNSAVRLCEIVITSAPQNCTTNQYFSSIDNRCISCPEGQLSFGCQSDRCYEDKAKISPSIWEPTPEPDEYIIDENIELAIMSTIKTNITWEEIKNKLSLAIDNDLSTVTELNGVADKLLVDLGSEDWMIGSVRLHLMFFTEWFSCSTHPCLASVDKYEDCKDEQSTMYVTVGNEGCDYITTTHDLTQAGQIYSVQCDLIGSHFSILNSVSQTFRLAEIVVVRGQAKPCKGNHYLKTPNYVCHPCEMGQYSYGCSWTSCTNDRSEVSSKHWEPYGINNYMGDIVPEKLKPQSVSQSVASSTNPASKAIDNDLSTFSLASVSNGDIWFRVEFEKNFFFYVVQVYQEFYSDWFYCSTPDDYCRVSLENYQECQNKGTNMKVDVVTNDTFVGTCGVITLTDQLTQASQKYEVTCEYVGNAVILSKTALGSGWIKLSEIVVYSRAQDCLGGQYLDTDTNICEVCPENSYSPGGFSTLVCTMCPDGSVVPPGLAASESDCQQGYTEIEKGVYSPWYSELQSGLIGKTTLLQHSEGRFVQGLLEISWFNDKVQVKNLCNETIFYIVREELVMVVFETDPDILLYFYSLQDDQNDENTPWKYQQDLGACREEETDYNLVFVSDNPLFGLISPHEVCEVVRVDDRWIGSIAEVPSQLPAQFMDEVEVGCEAGYFNGGDSVVTCLGKSFYHVKNSGPLCSARPDEEHQIKNITTSLSSPLFECEDPQGTQAIDNDLTTCTGAQSVDGEAWVEFRLNETKYVNNVTIFTVFYENWYNSEDPCVASEEAFLACKESEKGVEVSLYLGDTLVKNCGSIAENEGLAQKNQTFIFSCDAEGDRIKIKNTADNGVVRLFETVVTSLECKDPVAPLNGRIDSESYTHVTFSCDEGYHLLGNPTVSCLFSGFWEENPTCTPDCGVAEVPENAIVDLSNFTHTIFSCDEGFVLLGTAVVHCTDQSKSWTDIPQCTYDCGEPKPPVNGTVLSNNITHATFGCNEGYHADSAGKTVVSCFSSGLWEDSFQCHIDCGDIDVPFNVILETANFTHAKISCQAGFNLIGKSFLLCQESGEWDQSSFCHIDCGVPETPLNAVLQSNNFTHATFTCDEGFLFTKNSVVRCLETGVWEKTPECQADCGEVEAPLDGSIKSENTTHATFTCDEGFNILGTSSITCQEEGSWEEFPRCLTDCGEAVTPANGKINFENLTHAEVGCNRGFILVGDYLLECLESGNWESSPTCITDCGEPEEPLSGYQDTGNLTHATFVCEEGYHLLGAGMITCQTSGAWEETPRCAPDCGEVSDPDNGLVISQNLTRAILGCNEGYVLDGSSVLRCLGSGKWSETSSCLTDCGKVPMPEDGFVSSQNLTHATFGCNLGYLPVGGTNLVCLSDRNWSPEPSCHIDCGELFYPYNVKISSFNVTHTIITCDEGYLPIGETVVGCLSSGQWGDLPLCHIDCGEVEDPENGLVEVQNLTRTTFSCNDKYMTNGSSVLTCLASGFWSGTPSCVIRPSYIYHDFKTSAIKLSVNNSDIPKEGLLGYVTVSQQDDTYKNLVEIEWYHDKIKLWSICDGKELVIEGPDQEVVIAEVKDKVLFYFYQLDELEEFDEEVQVDDSVDDDNRYVQLLRECSEEGSGEIYLSVSPPDDVNYSVLSPDCEEVDADRWSKSRVTESSLLKYGYEVKIECEEGYFNRGEDTITCIWGSLFHSDRSGPRCASSPDTEHMVNITHSVVNSPLTECQDSGTVQAYDLELKSCSGSDAVDGESWMEFYLSHVRYVNNASIYSNFFNGWYFPGDSCVSSESAYQTCKTLENGTKVDIYLNGTFVKNCGYIQTNSKPSQMDQIYSIGCDAEGDMIRLSKTGDDVEIKVYEVVITSLDCPELIIENGLVQTESESNQNVIVCDETYRFYAETHDLNLMEGEHMTGVTRCLNGKWTPRTYCLPTCLSRTCLPWESCRMLHALPFCYSDCGEVRAPLNGTVKSANLTHTTFKCEDGFSLIGNPVISCLDSGVWDHSEGPWCSQESSGETLAISKNVFDVSRLVRWLGRWKFVARCPRRHLVKTCKCFKTADFPGNCEGSEISPDGTECIFTNSPDNNAYEVEGYAVCVKNTSHQDPCNHLQQLPLYSHSNSIESHHPNISCATPSHPLPLSCNVVVTGGNVITDWRDVDGVSEGTSEVKISKEGVCSVKCFDEGLGNCVLSLVCSMSTSSADHMAVNCPSCHEIACPPFTHCILLNGVPTCAKSCDGFFVLHGQVEFSERKAEVKCDDKYSYSYGTTFHSCEINGKWEPKPGRCVQQTCQTYNCGEEEYCRLITPDPPPYIHSSDPYDNKIIPHCFKLCPELKVPNARVINNNNETVHIICSSPSFRLTGSKFLECLPNGQWSDEIPTCRPALCSAVTCPPDHFCFENETLAFCRPRCPELQLENGTVENHNHTAHIKCNPGYYSKSSAWEETRVICNETGNWTESIPQCSLRCPDPAPLPPNTGTQNNTLSTLTTTCHENYTLVGTARRECGEDGAWSGTSTSCLPGSCSLITCSQFYRCDVLEHVAACLPFQQSDYEDFLSGCLQKIIYEDDCDQEISEVGEHLEYGYFLESFARSILRVKLIDNTQPYLITQKFLREISSREDSITETFMTTVIEIVEHYMEHIETLIIHENREVLVAQCMFLINKNIKNIQKQKTKEPASRTREQARQAWLDTSKKYRSNPREKKTKNPAYSGKYSEIMEKLVEVAQRLVNILGVKRDEL